MLFINSKFSKYGRNCRIIMIDLGILITGGIGLITTIVSGWTPLIDYRKDSTPAGSSDNIYNCKGNK